MNNNNLNGVDNLNNTPNQTPIQPQNNGSFNEQFNNNGLHNTSGTNEVMQQSSNNLEQPSINQTNGFNYQNINPTMQQQTNNMQNNNTNYTQTQNMSFAQQTNNQTPTNDDELLKIFIGKNYEKLTTSPFNFPSFFFGSAYMCYRKMFLYAIILYLIRLVILYFVNNFLLNIAFYIVLGFLMNKIYVFYAKNQIKKIKNQNQQKDFNEIKGICSVKGGTSVGKIFLGFFAQLGISLLISLIMLIAGFDNAFKNIFNFNGTKNDNKTVDLKNATLLEDINIGGYSCIFSNCTVDIGTSDNNEEYRFDANNFDFFELLKNYSEYVKINIYYTKKDDKKTIVAYKAYLKSTNEEIVDIETENELREKLGLYTIGTHTDTFTLIEIGTLGYGSDNGNEYTFINYTFVDGKNDEYEMTYIIPDGSDKLDLTENKTYTVTFEIVEGTFGFEYNIKNINQ